MRITAPIFPLLIAITFTITGCVASTPPPTDKEIRSYQQFNERSLDDLGLKEFIEQTSGKPMALWPLKKWRLDQLNMAAFYYNPDLDLARSQWQSIKASKITAGEIPNPSVSFSPTNDQGNSKSGLNPWTYPLNLSVPIEMGGKRSLRMANTENQADAIESRIITAAWNVRSHMVQAAINTYASDQSLLLTSKQAAAQKAVVDIFEQRSASGQGFNVSASQQTIAYRQTLLAIKDAEKQQAEAAVNLATAIGVPVDAIKNIQINWPDITQNHKLEIPKNFKEKSLQHHSQLLSALADYRAAHSALQIEIAKQIPDINLGPGYEWNAAGNKFVLGLSITLPIFNNNEGAIAEAEAKRKEAAERFNVLQAKIIADIDLALAHYHAALSKLNVAEQLSAAQATKFKNLSDHLGQGEVAKLPLLLAKAEDSSVALAQLDANVQLLRAKAELESSIEQPLFGDVDTTVTKQPARKGQP